MPTSALVRWMEPMNGQTSGLCGINKHPFIYCKKICLPAAVRFFFALGIPGGNGGNTLRLPNFLLYLVWTFNISLHAPETKSHALPRVENDLEI